MNWAQIHQFRILNVLLNPAILPQLLPRLISSPIGSSSERRSQQVTGARRRQREKNRKRPKNLCVSLETVPSLCHLPEADRHSLVGVILTSWRNETPRTRSEYEAREAGNEGSGQGESPGMTGEARRNSDVSAMDLGDDGARIDGSEESRQEGNGEESENETGQRRG